jgi:succinate dehydrogenase/fumarate reductase flavoprotein subunit
MKEYNAAVQTGIPFNPNVKDGRCTKNLRINKSNWANTLDTPPFEAYAVTCGITFSFGGLKINTEGQVINSDGEPIKGLYAAGSWSAGSSGSTIRGGFGPHTKRRTCCGRIAGRSAAKSGGMMRPIFRRYAVLTGILANSACGLRDGLQRELRRRRGESENLARLNLGMPKTPSWVASSSHRVLAHA